MTPNFNKVHLKFKINRIHYTYDDLIEIAYSFVKEGEVYEQAIGDFLLNWLDGKNYIEVNTSGSTGKPKRIKLKKQAMVNSAIATGDFFKLKPGDSALHCLPTKFIAGKMMLIRAMILGLDIDIIAPKMKPNFNKNRKYDFAAMVPLQLQNSLKRSSNIKTLIVGGAPVSMMLCKNIQDLKANVFETYGMTETVTHIAVKPLNNFEALGKEKISRPFKTLPNISISQDKRGCLVIDAPKVVDAKVVTNDIVKLHSETEFEWLGRFDNIINSGGVKLFPEQIESKLQSKISNRFFITSITNETFGEVVVLVLESDSNILSDTIFSVLTAYEKPKHIYAISKFIETDSGKIHRKKTFKTVFLA